MKNVDLLTSTDFRVATAATRVRENPLRFHLESVSVSRELLVFLDEAAIVRMPFHSARTSVSRGVGSSPRPPKSFPKKILAMLLHLPLISGKTPPRASLGSPPDFVRPSTRQEPGPVVFGNPENAIFIANLQLPPSRRNPQLNRIFTLFLHFSLINVTEFSVSAFFENLSGLSFAVRSLRQEKSIWQ